MTRSDDSKKPTDVPFVPAGPGMVHAFRCMGCGQKRVVLGARGVGVRRRCAVCVRQREAA